METIQAECTACGATGLYVGFAEPKGTAVVCISCDGTGCMEISFKPFICRKGKRGIAIVKRSAGTFIPTGVGPTGEPVTYQEFLHGKRP